MEPLVADAPAAAPRGLAWPGSCGICRRWSLWAFCAACRGRFAPWRPRCVRCALPLAAGGPLCGACIVEPPPFSTCVCAVDYVFPWDRIVARFKFDGQAELARPLARMLADVAPAAPAPPPDLFVPVPMSTERLASRGYDQAWELARRLGHNLRVPARAGVLVRRFGPRHQTGLPRQARLANLRGAFALEPGAHRLVRGSTVGLVDDVMTTGATAAEASSVLLDAGALRVDLWVVARTPAPGDED